MTNEERRVALNLARTKALAHAGAMDLSPAYDNAEKARTWAKVAEAMKDGDPVHDSPDGRPTGAIIDDIGAITR